MNIEDKLKEFREMEYWVGYDDLESVGQRVVDRKIQ